MLDEVRDQAALVSAVAWAADPSWAAEAAEHREILRLARLGDADGAASVCTTTSRRSSIGRSPVPGKRRAADERRRVRHPAGGPGRCGRDPGDPFAEDGTVDRDVHRALLRRLLDGGVRTLTPGGNTGEFYALTPAERRSVTELTLEEAGESATVLVGVGHDVPTAVATARHAAERGAAMVMVHQPAHPYISPAGWVDYHRAIAEAVPGLGVVPMSATPGARLRGAELADHCRTSSG